MKKSRPLILVLLSSLAFPTLSFAGESGKLTREVWTDLPGKTLDGLYRNYRIHEAPDRSKLISKAKAPSNWGDNYLQRLRGYITAPESGDYLFWVSGDDHSAFYLSTDSSKANAVEIASVVGSTGPLQWDKFPSQQSGFISLVAGQRYFIEVLHKEGDANDHLGIAWRTPSGARELIPRSALESFDIDPDDLDNDGLLDSFESAYGLDPADNGSANPNNGPLGDPDLDGYLNIEEQELGTHPLQSGGIPGFLTYDRWHGFGHGQSIADFKLERSYYGPPAFSILVDTSEIPSITENLYGGRLSGYLVAPTTGDYTFWVAGSGHAELSLSPDSDRFNKARIAYQEGEVLSQEWEGLPTQQSTSISLVAGERYYLEALLKEVGGDDHLAIAWRVPGGIRELIPASALESMSAQPNDQDRDGLRDDWEQLHALDFTSSEGLHGAQGDPDGDFAPNWLEYQMGTDPQDGASSQGYWMMDRWINGQMDYSITQLVSDSDFYDTPDLHVAIPKSGAETYRKLGGSRLRGFIAVPESGEYRFWLASATSAELLLSTDETPYRKKQIAVLAPELSTGHGVSYNSNQVWDSFLSQMSSPITLQAGQKYYLEVIHQNARGGPGHAHVAWAPVEGERSLIPQEFISPFFAQIGDDDDDSLPDSWEVQYGLDATDNGFSNITQQGERGDFDGDNLNNRQEYLLGTDPSSSDTDGDGLSDFQEAMQYGTNPTVSDTTSDTVVQTIDLTSFASSSPDWVSIGSGGILATQFRGSATWNFTVPSHGHWVVQMSGQLHGSLRIEETLPVIVTIDGHKVTRAQMTFHGDVPGTLRILTPWLPAGQHQFSIFIDNLTMRRSLEVSSIQIINPGGTDLDGSGLPDWADTQLRERSQLFSHQQFSHISPAFIEGRTPAQTLVDLTVKNHNISGTSSLERLKPRKIRKMRRVFARIMDRRASNLQDSMRQAQINPDPSQPSADGRNYGVAQSHGEGPGSSRWLTRIDLEPNDCVGYIAQFENHGHHQSGAIAWVPINILRPSSPSLTIPVGSTLLMGAWKNWQDQESVTLTLSGQSYPLNARESHAHLFDTAGSYQIDATHADGSIGSLTVEVQDATLPAYLATGEERHITTNLPGVSTDLSLDFNQEVAQSGLLSSGSPAGSAVRLAGRIPGRYVAAARLTADQSSGGYGDILTQTDTYVVGVSDALRHQSDIVSSAGGDTVLVRSPVLVTHLPPGAYVRVVIYAGGVTFPDGTTLQVLTEADLDANGTYSLEFLMPRARLGAPCHYINVHDASGKILWSAAN